MFKFLKKTVSKALGKFKKDIEEEAEIVEEVQETEVVEEVPEVQEEKKQEEVPKLGEPEEEDVEEEDVEEEQKVEEEKKEEIIKEEPVKEPELVKEVKKEEPKQTPKEKPTLKSKPEPEPKQTLEPEPVKEPKKIKLKEEKEELPEIQNKEETPEKKKGIFSKLKEKVTKFKLSQDKFEDLFWDLEVALLENNVAVEVIEKIKDDLREELTKSTIPRNKVDQLIAKTLKSSIQDLFNVESYDILEKAKAKKPFVIAMIGVNGAGKTTALAKLIKIFQDNKMTCVAAASDTFRAAAIQQLEEHTTNLGVKLIKSDYKSDPAAVAFDAVEHAKAKGIDIVLIDTAGRLHSNTNLMEELKKVIRVAKPDLKLFVGESITGNDCVEQAKVFDALVGIDGIILSKADVDEKGGAAISVSYITKRPILFLGTGQEYKDLEPFNPNLVIEGLGL